jgi:hypothetical protein
MRKYAHIAITVHVERLLNLASWIMAKIGLLAGKIRKKFNFIFWLYPEDVIMYPYRTSTTIFLLP